MSASNSPEATGLHPTARPAEKRADIRFSKKDTGLRDDVRMLGGMVGELLREQGGAALYESVERARTEAIARREGDTEAGGRLQGLLSQLSGKAARDFIRSFATYFQMVNTAEQVHRIRRRRDYLKEANTQQPGGLQDTLYKLKEHGLTLDETLALLRRMQIEPVFTAHPTLPTRRTILRKQQGIVRRLIDLQNPMLPPHERAGTLGGIRDGLTIIWQTDEQPGEARTSFDEMEHVLFFFTDVIYRALPVFYESLGDALVAVYGDTARDLPLPIILRFASGIGGDMDARPETTARTIRETLSRQRGLILDLYYNECRALAAKLSQSKTRVGVHPDIISRSEEYAGHFPNALSAVPLRHRDMPYRVFLRLIMQRLQSTYDDDIFPYESPDELLADLRLIARSLEENRGNNAGLFPTQRLIRRVETFGFHFLTLDIRQNARVNRRVVGHCLGEESWQETDARVRAQRIHTALERNESPMGEMDNLSRRDLSVFQAIAFCRRKFGQHAIGPYIVSMAHDVDDVLSVILLARWGELRKRNGSVPLDIAPYFETVEDLASSARIVGELLRDPIYRQHLERRENRQIVMVSYSDSNRDSGLVPARWSLQKAQSELARTIQDAGVELTMFHGRGGTTSRGGGKTHSAVLGSPPGSVRGRLRATEKGELVNAKYGLRGVALRTLEQAAGSVALATALIGKPPPQAQTWRAMMDTLTAGSRERYQGLVQDEEAFLEYFRATTPVDVLDIMRAQTVDEFASSGAERVLRTTVPWDFAWTQTRCMLPGWYGAGSGLTRVIQTDGIERLREAAAEWPFFRALLSDLEIVLAKADLEIARRYSELSPELHERFFPLLRAEFNLAVERLLEIKQQEVLLEKQAMLRRSIRLRNPYVDPMSLLQVELLRRWRSGGSEDPDLLKALMASVTGIALGLQDSG